MTKLIRINNDTHEKLGKYGNWSDTMDAIINRLLEQVRPNSKFTKLNVDRGGN
jgi:hypothetical protein